MPENYSQRMRLFILLLVCLFSAASLQAQYQVEVPSTLSFADMRLQLTPEARKKIQTDVDALTRHEKYFKAKVDKVDAYLPLIEQVLREEGVPDDIKYLVIQESALVGDAVSSSNAVGYWQFKEATGREVGLTINREVDERMNIITATRGAARYFKNNNTYFDNWLYALLAYYAGAGGAQKLADKKYYSKRDMKLDGRTHWYVIKFLAHKIAFEQAVGKNPRPDIQLFTYTNGNGKTLAQVAEEFELQESELEPYNKWVRSRRIPDDKTYFVIVPDYSGSRTEPLLARTEDKPAPRPGEEHSAGWETDTPTRFATVDDTRRFPLVEDTRRWGKKVRLINHIPGTLAKEGENIRDISNRTGVSPSRLVKYNDMISKEAVVDEGDPFYLKRKRNKALAHYHTVQPGETLWSVSQRFGIKLNKLLRNNRMREEEKIRPGRVLWLRFIRPPHIPVEHRELPVQDEKKPLATRQPKPGPAAQKPAEKKAERKAAAAQATAETRPAKKQPEESLATTPESQEKQPVKEEQKPPTVKQEQKPQAAEEKPLHAVISDDRQKAASASDEYHTVQVGETLYSIARSYDLTIPQLTSYNDISWEAPLSVGQKLRLSPPQPQQEAPQGSSLSAGPGNFMVHEVQPGETMYRIARQYEVTIKELMQWNEKQDFSVSVGEKLKVKRP